MIMVGRQFLSKFGRTYEMMKDHTWPESTEKSEIGF